MGKQIVDFSCKVRGGFSPNGLQKVFFSFHPDDKEPMERMVDEIWSLVNCAIYYHTDSFSADELNLEDLTLKLQGMKLFVIIVTTNYLSKDSFARNWEYAFAVKNNIPFLPIAMESGLEEYFSRVMNQVGKGFGDVQLLRYQVADSTEISFRQKLVRDLNAILVNDTDLERIKKAVPSKIFLSYRKKDRKYANELIRMIHNIPSLQNVGIWYDEFISTGEAWSDQIWEALETSEIFLLLVTPSIVEPDNYVIRKEYPVARNRKMTIVPAKKAQEFFTEQDIRELSRLFPDIGIFVDGDNADALEDALISLADEGDSTPEKEYLVGMAFFNGINVEKDSEKAVSLIFASAKKGLPEAMNKLADMFWNGDGVGLNHQQSIDWRKRFLFVCRHKISGESDSSESLHQYMSALKRLCEDLFELSAYRDALHYGIKLMETALQLVDRITKEEYESFYTAACDINGKICLRLGFFDQANDFFEKYCDFQREMYETETSVINLHNLSVGYERIGDVNYAVGNYEVAAQWYKKVLSVREEIDSQLCRVDSAFSLSCAYLLLGDVLIRKHKFEEADSMYEKAVSLRRRILNTNDSARDRQGYAEAVASRGRAKILTGHLSDAKIFMDEAAEIFGELAEKLQTLESWRNYSVTLNHQGKIEVERERFSEALLLYEKSLALRKKILAHSRVDGAVFDCALTAFFIAECGKKLYDKKKQKQFYEETIALLRPILIRDGKGDWHIVFAEAAFERFQLDTYTGKQYLKYAASAWNWLAEKYSDHAEYKKKYGLCLKLFQRCYPE